MEDSGSSHFECLFKIPPHILKLHQKDEDKFSLSIDQYKFLALLAEERCGNLEKLKEEQNQNPLDDVDKLLNKQLEKEEKEKKEKEEKERAKRKEMIKEINKKNEKKK